MAKLNPYVRFNGNAREAFEFYKSCLGGTVTYTTVGESPMGKDMPDKSKIFHAELTSGKLVLLGSDMVDEKGLSRGNGVVLTISCDSKEEAGMFFFKTFRRGNGRPSACRSAVGNHRRL